MSVAATSATSVEVVYSGTVVLPSSDPTAWTIETEDDAVVPTVTAVAVDGDTVTLTTTEHTHGAAYALNSSLAIYAEDGIAGLVQPFSDDYTGIGIAPTVVSVRGIDERTLRVSFSEAMLEADALEPESYVLAGPSNEASVTVPEVLAVTKVDARTYDLRTTALLEGTAYSLTVTGLRDAALNPAL